jgi:hypothetical protein
MAVNDARVRLIISHAIQHAGHSADTCCGSVRQAWRNLKAWRDVPPAGGASPNSLDLDVAAAENYMFARACVCEGFVSATQMRTIAVGYFATKLVGVKMPTSGNPQSKLDAGVLGWGSVGAQEGEANRQRCNPTISPPLWRPVNEIMDLGKGYQGQLGRPGTRYTPPAPRS